MILMWYPYDRKVKMLIARSTDYAVRALCFMAKRGGLVTTVSLLVQELGVPKPFMRKIMQVLNKRGMLKSYKGIRGGFELSIDANDIHLIDIMGIFQGPLRLNECIFKKKICPNITTCYLSRKMQEIENYAYSALKNISIKSILEESD